MCPFVEKKEKSVVFTLTYKYQETAYTIFSNPSNPLFLIIILMSNPPSSLLFSYYSGLKSKSRA